IGTPIANTRLYILDGEMGLAPVGVRGELYIAGAGLARGYWRRPDLTAGRFVPDPFASEGGGRIYRTGDLARHRPDGEIDFLGRADNQVKLRGYRIELGEISSELSSHHKVREAVALVRGDGKNDRLLVVYYTGEEVGAEALRAHLLSKLPEYMVP